MKTMKGRGGVVENIDIENIEVEHSTQEALRINMRYSGEPLDDQSQPDENIPIVRNFYINNFVCHRTLRALNIRGIKDHEIQNVYIENSTIRSDKIGTIENATVNMENVSFLQNLE